MAKTIRELILDSVPNNNMFKTRLQNLDPEFIVSETSPSVALFHLPHGIYVGLYHGDKRILISMDVNGTKYRKSKVLSKEVDKYRKKYAKKIVTPYIETILDDMSINYEKGEK